MAFIPMAVQLLPLIPGLVESVFKIVQAVRSDPATPVEAKANLAQVEASLQETLKHVKAVRLPNDAK